jgi:rhodanese-related sulfurtransferase
MSRKHNTGKTAASNPSRYHHQKKRSPYLKWLWVGLGILFVAGLIILLSGSGNDSENEITVAQAHEKYQQGAFFLDVRTQDEWDQGHIARSTLIPLNDLESRLSELPMDGDIVVVCRSGLRSRDGVNILQKAGFTRVTCMSGGILAWTAAGYSLESGMP